MKTTLLSALFLLLLSTSFAREVVTVKVYSTSMQKEIPCNVIYPDSYKAGQTRYPVVYLLHGRGGNYRSWLAISPDLETYVDQYQVIVVCPDGGDYSWYLDSPVIKDFKYETFTSAELVSYVDKNYRTIADKKHRAISGFSMGGHGALFLAIKHLDVFGAASSMSGGLDMRPSSATGTMQRVLKDINEDPASWDAHAVFNLVDSLKGKELVFSIDCGVNDTFISINRRTHQKLLDLQITHDYIERPGGHTGAYWGNAVAYHLLFFSNYFRR